MIESIEQRNNRANLFDIRDRGERAIELRRLHGQPENIARRNRCSPAHIGRPAPQRAVELNFLRVGGKRLGSDDQRHRFAAVREAGGDESTYAASS